MDIFYFVLFLKEIKLVNRNPDSISDALMQANVARSFLRLALAINGVTDKYGNDESSFNDFNLKLPIFVSADFFRNEHTCSCSASKHPYEEDEENVAYSDDVYGHLWFTKRIKIPQVTHIC